MNLIPRAFIILCLFAAVVAAKNSKKVAIEKKDTSVTVGEIDQSKSDDQTATNLDIILAGGGGKFGENSAKKNAGEGSSSKINIDYSCKETPTRFRGTGLLPKDIEISGDTSVRSRESVYSVLRGHLGGLKYAAEAFSTGKEDICWQWQFQISINASGSIALAKISSSNTSNKSLDKKMLEKVKGISFAPVNAGELTHVIFPFTAQRKM